MAEPNVQGVRETTIVIAHERFHLLEETYGTRMTALDRPDTPSEYFEFADLVDVAAFLMNRARQGLELIREN